MTLWVSLFSYLQERLQVRVVLFSEPCCLYFLCYLSAVCTCSHLHSSSQRRDSRSNSGRREEVCTQRTSSLRSSLRSSILPRSGLFSGAWGKEDGVDGNLLGAGK